MTARPRLTFDVYLTGGIYLGPARTLAIALGALAARTAPAGVPVGTIWERRGDGHHHVVRTVYGEQRGEQRGEQEDEIEKEVDQR